MASSTKQNQDRFLEAFAASLSITAAAKEVNVGVNTVGNWRRNDAEGFRARFNQTNESRLDNLEERMFQVIGWATREENFAQALRYPTLLMFALKAGRPQYRDSVQAATGAADLVSALAKISDSAGDAPDTADNIERDERGKPVVPITKEQHDKLEGSVADQLKDIFKYSEE